mgnify:CR=1 FL=1
MVHFDRDSVIEETGILKQLVQIATKARHWPASPKGTYRLVLGEDLAVHSHKTKQLTAL